MERIVTRRTYTKEVTEDVVEYKAKDGTIFDRLVDCEDHERKLDLMALGDIKTCKALDGYRPFDGEEYTNMHNYTWYLPTSSEEIKKLKEAFPGAMFTNDVIGHWICVEDSDYWSYATTLDDCIAYARKILDHLGYEMTVSPKTNT